ncbi:hypothetical protein [Paenibacillus phytohabitans]|uniref:hypothetical protein n=1 Tax=Paenibacillus phytohabitans TaxID=2654978 RepID=UPI0030086D02
MVIAVLNFTKATFWEHNGHATSSTMGGLIAGFTEKDNKPYLYYAYAEDDKNIVFEKTQMSAMGASTEVSTSLTKKVKGYCEKERSVDPNEEFIKGLGANDLLQLVPPSLSLL